MWSKLLRPLDKLIDGITMYRLLLYYLLAILAAAIILSISGDIHYKASYIAISASILVITCYVVNKVFSYIFDVPTNPESSLLTALILALIITPTPTGYNLLFLLAASGLAMASKYILNINYKHIFNPAAVAVVLTAFGPRQSASWWVGTAALLPVVIIGGLLLIRKTRREYMFMSFLVATTLATTVLSITSKSPVGASLHSMVFSSAAFFLGFVMLTEPYTSPTTKNKQIFYAILVGVLLPPQVHLGSTYSSPEIALVLGNVYAYLSGSKSKLMLQLDKKYRIARSTVEFAFYPTKKFSYQPGQYMEFTLPHHQTDSRGARRYFTLASSPTEEELKLGVKFYEKGSSYKHAMLGLDDEDVVIASQLAGDFVLPKNKSKKIAFIAGGIGITPFRSMTKYMLDKNDPRDVVLLYAAATKEDLAYRDMFDQASHQINMTTHYVLSDSGTRISQEVIEKTVPDYLDRIFYISGTHMMVEGVQEQLHTLGVKHKNIKIDFFPGYA